MNRSLSQKGSFDIESTDVSHAVIEIFGGDNNLSEYVLQDLEEVISKIKGKFSFLALVDFLDDGGGVFEVTSKGKRLIEDWGEINTGDPEILALFIKRALETYPPEVRLALGFWDHGSGVFDEDDPFENILSQKYKSLEKQTAGNPPQTRRLFIANENIAPIIEPRAMLHDDTNGGVLTNKEAHSVVQSAFKSSKRKNKIDLIFSDTCLNGMIEVLEQFSDFSEVVIGSEDLEPGDGWEYDKWFELMEKNPPKNANQWAEQAIDSFNSGYKNRPEDFPCTLGAFRTDQKITSDFAELVAECKKGGQQVFGWLSSAMSKTQSFDLYDTYDIRDFAEKLINVAEDQIIQDICRRLIQSFDNARIASTALGDTVRDSHGLAFWFPHNKRSYREVQANYKDLRFNNKTSWSSYLGDFFQ